MLRVVVRRVLALVPTLIGIVIVSFLLVQLMPGDAARILAGENATPEAVEHMRRGLGLDKPLWQRVSDYVARLLRGDLGVSPRTQRPVWERIASSLPVTLSLAVVSMAMTTVFGIAAGVVAALRRGGLMDRAITALSAVFQAIPPFLIGLVLVIALAVDRSFFPTSGYVGLTENPAQWLRHLVLPAFTLAVSGIAELARQTRGAMIDVFDQDFLRAVRARGLHERVVVGKHAAKSAATQVVTVLGMQFGRVLGGAVVIERIFALPGFGAVSLDAVLGRDVVLIQGVVLVGAAAVLLTNLLVDISYGYLNPKVRV